MGIFAFLTTRRLQAELTRQRDEIARLHQELDAEEEQRHSAGNKTEQYARENSHLVEQCAKLRTRLQARETAWKEEKDSLLKKWDAQCSRLQEEHALRIQELQAQASSLRQELEAGRRQRAEVTAQNALLAEKVAAQEEELHAQRAQLTASQSRAAELEAEKEALQEDLNRIVGKLSRW